ncbi:MAG: sulfurtransferase [Deltaproteobacteria bacterium]|nr:MAG: sulfurtransferase [Deltaproteobacteria bacterium]
MQSQTGFRTGIRARRLSIGLAFFMVLLTIGPPAQAADPLVDTDWITLHLNDNGIRILDLQSVSSYRAGHIPGAVHTRYADWRTTDSKGTPGMLPPKEYLERLIGGLGIDNQTYVVLVPPGYHVGDVAMATRVYWTFKVLGHDKISILNGGMADYIHSPLARLDRNTPMPERKSFTARINREDTPDSGDILKLGKNKTVLVDSRSPGEYDGKIGSNANQRSGTIPGAINLPYDNLVKSGTGKFLDRTRLELIFKEKKIPATEEQVYFCHTGHRASLSWFVSHELLGNQQAKMYDGSMAEWARNPELPMVTGASTGRQ